METVKTETSLVDFINDIEKRTSSLTGEHGFDRMAKSFLGYTGDRIMRGLSSIYNGAAGLVTAAGFVNPAVLPAAACMQALPLVAGVVKTAFDDTPVQGRPDFCFDHDVDKLKKKITMVSEALKLENPEKLITSIDQYAERVNKVWEKRTAPHNIELLGGAVVAGGFIGNMASVFAGPAFLQAGIIGRNIGRICRNIELDREIPAAKAEGPKLVKAMQEWGNVARAAAEKPEFADMTVLSKKQRSAVGYTSNSSPDMILLALG